MVDKEIEQLATFATVEYCYVKEVVEWIITHYHNKKTEVIQMFMGLIIESPSTFTEIWFYFKDGYKVFKHCNLLDINYHRELIRRLSIDGQKASLAGEKLKELFLKMEQNEN